MDIKLSGHFIKEIHCVFVSETNDQGEGETPTCLSVQYKTTLNTLSEGSL